MAKRKITLFDFRREYVNNVPSFKYKFTYTSPITNKEWVMYSNDSTIFDDLRDDSTTQKRLREIKDLIKWYDDEQKGYTF